MDKKKIDKKWIRNLESENTDVVVSTLDSIRKEGFIDYLPIIADLFVKEKSATVRDKISSVFQDLKDTRGVQGIMELLKHTSNNELKSMLLTACWSSSLDFSGYLEDFVDIALEGEYMQIFEVVTVVENFEHIPSQDQLDRSLKRVETNIMESSDLKGEMLNQLLLVLKSF
jgi:hypothetical protein